MASTPVAARPLLQRVLALQELDRRECAADPCVFMERHVSIEEPDGRVIPLELWDFQRQAVDAIHNDGRVIVLKARRLGLSWIMLAYALWLAIFQQGIRILVLCKTEADASELLDRIRRMRDRISDEPTAAHLLATLKPVAKSRDAVTTLDVGQSTIRALVGTEQAARSETAGLVLLDEFAFQRSAPGIWRAILPTIEGGGRLGVISTGNGASTTGGTGAEFASQWSRASSGESDLTPLFFPWNSRPDRDEAWKQRTMAALGDPERFRTEYPQTPADAFTQPDANFVFDPAGVDAAERLGREFDRALATNRLPPPVGNRIALGVDWGDFRTHAVIVWELERGGIYIPPQEIAATQTDAETMTRHMLDAAAKYDWWLAEERYDASFKNTNRTFAKTAEGLLGPHNNVYRTGRPNTVPVAFGTYKSMSVTYLRLLLRRTAEGHRTRVLAVSPTNSILLEQMRAYQQNEDGKFEKGNDDAVDSLIAGVQPVAKRYRDVSDDIVAAA